MDAWFFWMLLLFAAVTFYRLLQRESSPRARVTVLLRRYHALKKSGLSEHEALLRLLATRAHWKRLPLWFLGELVSRLQNKEDLMRFVSVSEDSNYARRPYPELSKLEPEAAMAEIACLFSAFGFRLQSAGRYKEAEFVQRLALRLQPDQYFTTLPLAATYYETGRHAEAVPLFERGLARVEESKTEHDGRAGLVPPSKCLAPDAQLGPLRNRYKTMYEACLKALLGIQFLAMLEFSVTALSEGF